MRAGATTEPPCFRPTRRSPALYAILGLVLAAGCGPSRFDQLIQACGSDDLPTRRAALRQIAEFGEEGRPAGSTLVALSRDDDAETRRLCCLALGNLFAETASDDPPPDLLPEVREALAARLDDRETSVRMTAAYASLEIDPSETRAQEVLSKAMLRGDGGVIDRLGKQNPPPIWAVPTLVDILEQDRRAGNRRLAAVALGRIPKSTPLVITALESALEDRNDRVQAAAQEALRQIEQRD